MSKPTMSPDLLQQIQAGIALKPVSEEVKNAAIDKKNKIDQEGALHTKLVNTRLSVMDDVDDDMDNAEDDSVNNILIAKENSASIEVTPNKQLPFNSAMLVEARTKLKTTEISSTPTRKFNSPLSDALSRVIKYTVNEDDSKSTNESPAPTKVVQTEKPSGAVTVAVKAPTTHARTVSISSASVSPVEVKVKPTMGQTKPQAKVATTSELKSVAQLIKEFEKKPSVYNNEAGQPQITSSEGRKFAAPKSAAITPTSTKSNAPAKPESSVAPAPVAPAIKLINPTPMVVVAPKKKPVPVKTNTAQEEADHKLTIELQRQLNEAQINEDRMLAAKLQEEEDRIFAAKLQVKELLAPNAVSLEDANIQFPSYKVNSAKPGHAEKIATRKNTLMELASDIQNDLMPKPQAPIATIEKQSQLPVPSAKPMAPAIKLPHSNVINPRANATRQQIMIVQVTIFISITTYRRPDPDYFPAFMQGVMFLSNWLATAMKAAALAIAAAVIGNVATVAGYALTQGLFNTKLLEATKRANEQHAATMPIPLHSGIKVK